MSRAHFASLHHAHDTVEELQAQIDALHYDLRFDTDGEVRRRIAALLERKNAILTRSPVR